jgi:hypothetical protein
MRVILVIVLVVFVMAVAGWIGFRRGDGRASIEVKTDKIQQDTSDAIRRTGEWMDGSREQDVPSPPAPKT